MNNETINVLAQIISGQKDIDAGMREMQQIAERVMQVLIRARDHLRTEKEGGSHREET